MSKIGNYRVSIQETDAYKQGWQISYSGHPRPQQGNADPADLAAQQLGWDDYHAQQRDEPLGIEASTMNGNAAQRHANPAAWENWVNFCERNGMP
jgi:hypothetical protein